jgi:hypothetical protein
MENIKDFLTPETREYYETVIKIVNDLETISGAQISIFGGFVRSLIEGNIPRDVDMWFKYTWPHFTGTPGIWRRRITAMIPQIREKHTIKDEDIKISKTTDTEKIGEDIYEIATIKIDGIDFDFCCNTSSHLSFKTLADFSVNNLYIGLNGTLKTRVLTHYTVSDIIGHIKERKLIDITDMEVIKSHLDPYCSKYNLDYYKNKMVLKGVKMISYGYNF